MATTLTSTSNLKENENMDVWKAALDDFLQQKLIRDQMKHRPMILQANPSNSNGHHQALEDSKELNGASELDNIDMATMHPMVSATAPQVPVSELSIHIARNLIRIADKFEKDRAVRTLAHDGPRRPEAEGLSEEQILTEIKSMNGSINVQTLARILKNSVSICTLEASLDYIIQNTEGWPRVALSFDLVAALYATRAAVDNITWIRDVATNYLQRTHSIPGDGDLMSILNYESPPS